MNYKMVRMWCVAGAWKVVYSVILPYMIFSNHSIFCLPTFDQTRKREIMNLLSVAISVHVTGEVCDEVGNSISHTHLIEIGANSSAFFPDYAEHPISGKSYLWAQFVSVQVGQDFAQESIRRGCIGVYLDELGSVSIGYRLFK